MGKAKTSTYTLTLKLNATKSDIAALDKYFESSRKLYNALLGEGLKRFKLMRESKEYKNAKSIKDKKLKSDTYRSCELKYGFSTFSLNKFSTSLRVNEFKEIDANTVQALSSRAVESINKLRFGNAKRVNFIKYEEMYSIEGTTNRQGITYRDGIIKFRKLRLPIIIRKNDTYAQQAIQDRVKFCRIVRKEIKGKTKYYIQLVLEGIPPQKIDKDTGEIKGSVGMGTVGIDIGTRTIAIASKYDCKLLELAEGLDDISKKEKVLSRRLDRQRRANNPNKYNTDGIIIRGNRDKWIKSKNYLKTQSKLKDIRRKIASQRKDKHEKMANYILSLGDTILVETMSYSGLQARSKNTTVNEKTGKFNKKKRFGKSLANKAPSKLLEIINRKLKYEGLKLYKINTYKVKASQYNPFDECYVKKQLSERWNYFKCENKEIKIQRDLMSALIIKNVIVDKKEKLDTVNRENLLNEFNEFKILHDKEINRIKNCGNKLISSMGI